MLSQNRKIPSGLGTWLCTQRGRTGKRNINLLFHLCIHRLVCARALWRIQPPTLAQWDDTLTELPAGADKVHEPEFVFSYTDSQPCLPECLVSPAHNLGALAELCVLNTVSGEGSPSRLGYPGRPRPSDFWATETAGSPPFPRTGAVGGGVDCTGCVVT